MANDSLDSFINTCVLWKDSMKLDGDETAFEVKLLECSMSKRWNDVKKCKSRAMCMNFFPEEHYIKSLLTYDPITFPTSTDFMFSLEVRKKICHKHRGVHRV